MIGYGDWTASRLLEVSIPRCAGGFVGISTGIPTTEFIATVRQQLSRTINGIDDRPNIFEMVWLLPPLTFSQRKEIFHQLGKFIQTRQLTICEDITGMRCYLCAGPAYWFAICGNMYMNKCSGVLQHFTLQTDREELENLVGVFRTQAKLRPSFRNEREKANKVQKDCTHNVKEEQNVK